MQIIIAAVVLAVIALLAFLGLASSPKRPPYIGPGPKTGTPEGDSAATVAAVTALDRGAMETMLDELADAPEPEKKPGAMCYAVAAMPGRTEYVCPDCGEKTLYVTTGLLPTDGDDDATGDAAETGDAGTSTDVRVVTGGVLTDVAWEIASARREMQALREVAGGAVRLDESEFCRKCSPDAEAPQLRLIVAFADGSEHVTRGVRPSEIRVLREFLEGKTEHTTSNDGITPLADSMPVIRKLLGLDDTHTPAAATAE